jgi:hypothetical protein
VEWKLTVTEIAGPGTVIVAVIVATVVDTVDVVKRTGPSVPSGSQQLETAAPLEQVSCGSITAV